MPKYLLERVMKGTANFAQKSPSAGGLWAVQKYKVFGRVEIGESVTVHDGDEVYTGIVVYIHPCKRFFQIQANGEAWRTSFAFPSTKGDD